MPDPENSSSMKILTFGAGAVGTYIGGSLALAAHQVVFIEQPKVVEFLRDRGLGLDLTIDPRRKGNAKFVLDAGRFACAVSLTEALSLGPFDFAVFALKSFDTPAAVEAIRPVMQQMPPVLCLSNGVENEKLLGEVLGEGRVLFGTVTTAIGRSGPSDIVLEKLRGVGVARGHPLSEKVAGALDQAFLNCQLFSDAQSMKWSKMLTNLIANPTSAILDMTAAEVFANPDLYRLEISMLRECLEVMKAKGLNVVNLPGTPVRALAWAARWPLWLSRPFLARAAGAGRGGKMPSFHIDLHSGRGQSEVEYLHGAVVRSGIETGIPTPVNRLLTNTLLALTRKEIPLDAYAGQPQKLVRAARLMMR
jgi:2-dehydropantoate 2-reductase